MNKSQMGCGRDRGGEQESDGDGHAMGLMGVTMMMIDGD